MRNPATSLFLWNRVARLLGRICNGPKEPIRLPQSLRRIRFAKVEKALLQKERRISRDPITRRRTKLAGRALCRQCGCPETIKGLANFAVRRRTNARYKHFNQREGAFDPRNLLVRQTQRLKLGARDVIDWRAHWAAFRIGVTLPAAGGALTAFAQSAIIRRRFSNRSPRR